MKIIQNLPSPPAKISQVIESNGNLYISGQIAMDFESGKLLLDLPLEEQTEVIIKNLKTLLEHSGSNLEKIVKINVYLATMKDFPNMCSVYEKYFSLHKPARTTIGAELYSTALVEMECIAEV